MGSESSTGDGTTTTVSEGIEIRHGARGATLRIKFVWRGKRCREGLKIKPTPANIKYAIRLRGEIINAIERGTFDYATTFPNSTIGKEATRLTDVQAAKRITLDTLFTDYLAAIRAYAKRDAKSPSTVATYVKWVRARLRPKFGGIWLDELSTAMLLAWINELIESKLADKSIRNVVGVMSAVLTYAVTAQLIPSNPLTPIRLKDLIGSDKKKKHRIEKADPFNADEIAAILSACDREGERALFQFMLSTGVRNGEAMALRWRSVDWHKSTIHIVDNVVDAEVGTAEKDDKTGALREIPMIPSARAALEIMKPISFLKNEYVFLNADGVRWQTTQQMRTRWALILRRAGVRYRPLRQTRHTFASTLLMAGERELLVAKLLGHNTVEMVRRTYGRFIPQTDGIQLKSDYAGLGLPKLRKVSG